MGDPLEDLAAAVRRGEVTATELATDALARVEALDGPLGTFVHLDPDGALAAAEAVDATVRAGVDPGPLAGVPFGVKDLEDARGMPTRRGSRWYADAGPADHDDLHVSRLRAAGAVPIGKTATPEFGSAAYTASLLTGVTRNPWDPARTPGGSSGGTAAAVAAGLIPFGTASDGGGSIRTPAGFCGLPGLRPSYGRVPTLGVTHVAQNAVLFALAPTVRATALLLDVCAGPDPRDRTCLPPPSVSYRAAVDALDVTGLRVAYSPAFGLGPVAADVSALVEPLFERLCEAAGLTQVDLVIDLPSFADTYAKVEGLDRWIDLPEGLWPEQAELLGPELQPGWASSARARLPQLGAVYTARRRLEHAVAALFDQVDLIVTPTAGFTAFPAEGRYPTAIDGVPVHPFVGLAQPILASLCNLPAMSVPAGLDPGGVPVGMQLIAPLHLEDRCLRLARIVEETSPWPTLPGAAAAFR